MRLLLDTHALVWWWKDDPRLPAKARAVIADPVNTVYVSAVSAWEIATRQRLGKWPEADHVVAEYTSLVRRSRFNTLAIGMEHALRSGSLPGPHRDPFDRMLIAQAEIEAVPVVTADSIFQAYGAETIWA